MKFKLYEKCFCERGFTNTASFERCAERAFLSKLGGGCLQPVAAFAQKNEGIIILTGTVISVDGKQGIRLSAVDKELRRLGERLAELVF